MAHNYPDEFRKLLEESVAIILKRIDDINERLENVEKYLESLVIVGRPGLSDQFSRKKKKKTLDVDGAIARSTDASTRG